MLENVYKIGHSVNAAFILPRKLVVGKRQNYLQIWTSCRSAQFWHFQKLPEPDLSGQPDPQDSFF